MPQVDTLFIEHVFSDTAF